MLKTFANKFEWNSFTFFYFWSKKNSKFHVENKTIKKSIFFQKSLHVPPSKTWSKKRTFSRNPLKETKNSFCCEVDCTAPVHFFKTYYGRVDAINSILSICGHDRKSRRKTLRVDFCVWMTNFIKCLVWNGSDWPISFLQCIRSVERKYGGTGSKFTRWKIRFSLPNNASYARIRSKGNESWSLKKLPTTGNRQKACHSKKRTFHVSWETLFCFSEILIHVFLNTKTLENYVIKFGAL